MIIVDTNVISELANRESPCRRWLREAASEELYLSAATLAEVTYGISRLPDGRRKDGLLEWWDRTQSAWSDRVIDMTAPIANMAGVIKAQREGRGRPIGIPDAIIAATCLVHHARLATRNIKDFEGLGIDLIDPWQCPTDQSRD